MPPPIMSNKDKMDRKADIFFFTPQDSNFLVNGKSINAIIKANTIGISTVFARIKIANKATTVAMTKKIFRKDKSMSNMCLIFRVQRC